jgi:hypothetical protein
MGRFPSGFADILGPHGKAMRTVWECVLSWLVPEQGVRKLGSNKCSAQGAVAGCSWSTRELDTVQTKHHLEDTQ